MVPAWWLLAVLLAGVAAGWFLHARLAPGRAAARPAPPPEPEPPVEAPAEPELKMEAVLSELERRYQGRRAEPEPTKPARRPRAPKRPA